MRSTLFILLLVLALTGEVRASGAITIEISTTDAGVGYALYKQGYGLNREPKTPDEIGAWLGGAIKQVGDRERIFIYMDERTSFKAVLDMLRRFKAAGVKHFVVCVGKDADVRPALSGSLDDLRWYDAAPAAK